MNTILFTEDQWRNSQLSIARFYGGLSIGGQHFTIVNKDGKDLFELSIKATGQYAIPPGEPADLVNDKYLKQYRKLGRDKFLDAVKSGEIK
ncbi:MAG: hypothetical protein ACI4TK_05910 [Agathobacter sp.]